MVEAIFHYVTIPFDCRSSAPLSRKKKVCNLRAIFFVCKQVELKEAAQHSSSDRTMSGLLGRWASSSAGTTSSWRVSVALNLNLFTDSPTGEVVSIRS